MKRSETSELLLGLAGNALAAAGILLALFYGAAAFGVLHRWVMGK